MCWSHLWSRMSNPHTNTKMHGSAICSDECMFRVSIEIQWLCVTDKQQCLVVPENLFFTIWEVFFCISVVKTLMCCNYLSFFQVCWWCTINHCNIKKKTFLTNVFMCVHFRSSFFPSGFFSHGHCSSPIITFTKLTCYNMYLRIFTHHTHTNALSFTPNQQQKNLSNKRVAHVGFTKHEYQTIKHEIYSYNHEWQHLQRITQISFCRSRLAIIHEQRIQHIIHT